MASDCAARIVPSPETAELKTVGGGVRFYSGDVSYADGYALPRPCLLDGELLAWDDAVSLDLVKPARGGTRRRWALVLFDVTCAQVETADDEARHALLEGV